VLAGLDEWYRHALHFAGRFTFVSPCPSATVQLKMLSRPRSVSSRPNPTLDGPCIATQPYPSLHLKLINAVLRSYVDL
jgi:hypothetical protein